MKKYRIVLGVIAIIASVILGICVRSDTSIFDNFVIPVSGNETRQRVIPLGEQMGVYLETEGVLVVSVCNVSDQSGVNYTPALDKINAGDYIVALNDIDISSKLQLGFLINKYGENELKLTIKSDNSYRDVYITPVKVSENEYKIGTYVRDDAQGIGTITYVKEDGSFGALGHGINDIDTGELLGSQGGLLYNAKIYGIIKGEKGKSGGLCGTINYTDENKIGCILKNTEKGIFGKMNKQEILRIQENYEGEYYDVARKDEITIGSAYIISCLSGEREKYEIEIQEIDDSIFSESKGMIIKVTDKELLNLTNGIVQGMSGSPIVQNGKVVGAVTHVFVNDPTKGYGIFIEEMLEND